MNLRLPERLRIGTRTFKTALGVVLILLLGLTPIISTPFYAALGTIQGMQPTVSGSKKEARGRITGCIIGGIIGYLFYALNINNPIMAGLAVIICILICNAINLSKSIYITLTICISVLTELSSIDPLMYAVLRTWDTSLGILVGVSVNRFIMRPNYIKNLHDAFDSIAALTEQAMVGYQHVVYFDQLPVIKKEMTRLDAYFRDYGSDLDLEDETHNHESLEQKVNACHELYFHLKCLRLLKEEDLVQPLDSKMTAFHLSKVHDNLRLLRHT